MRPSSYLAVTAIVVTALVLAGCTLPPQQDPRVLVEDLDASPEVHPVTVADLADELTRLGLIAAPTSCG